MKIEFNPNKKIITVSCKGRLGQSVISRDTAIPVPVPKGKIGVASYHEYNPYSMSPEIEISQLSEMDYIMLCASLNMGIMTGYHMQNDGQSHFSIIRGIGEAGHKNYGQILAEKYKEDLLILNYAIDKVTPFDPTEEGRKLLEVMAGQYAKNKQAFVIPNCYTSYKKGTKLDVNNVREEILENFDVEKELLSKVGDINTNKNYSFFKSPLQTASEIVFEDIDLEKKERVGQVDGSTYNSTDIKNYDFNPKNDNNNTRYKDEGFKSSKSNDGR